MPNKWSHKCSMSNQENIFYKQKNSESLMKDDHTYVLWHPKRKLDYMNLALKLSQIEMFWWWRVHGDKKIQCQLRIKFLEFSEHAEYAWSTWGSVWTQENKFLISLIFKCWLEESQVYSPCHLRISRNLKKILFQILFYFWKNRDQILIKAALKNIKKLINR